MQDWRKHKTRVIQKQFSQDFNVKSRILHLCFKFKLGYTRKFWIAKCIFLLIGNHIAIDSIIHKVSHNWKAIHCAVSCLKARSVRHCALGMHRYADYSRVCLVNKGSNPLNAVRGGPWKIMRVCRLLERCDQIHCMRACRLGAQEMGLNSESLLGD